MIRLAPGEVFAGKLRLEHNIASGGMGTVWRAWNTQLGIPVAVKVMAASLSGSPELIARFEREARAAAQIRSPHVVNIYEHGVHDGLPYIVMELLEGEDLQQRLSRERRLPVAAVARIVRDICKVLQRAHELGIVHRDLKPANVFLVRDIDDEVVKVLDFGIAKVDAGGNITASGEIMGTPRYMSLEQLGSSKHVDHRADLWAVGVIAFRALTGQLPFSGTTIDIVQQLLNDAIPAPSSIAPDLSPAVDAFFARALARDIDQRFQGARELSEALAKLAGHESGAAPSSQPLSAQPLSAQPLSSQPSSALPRSAPSLSALPSSTPQGAGPAADDVQTVVEAARAAPAPTSPSPGAAPPPDQDGSTVQMVGRATPAAFLASSAPAGEQRQNLPLGAPAFVRSEVAPQPATPPLSPLVPATPAARRRGWVVWAAAFGALLALAALVWAAVSMP